MDIKAQPTHIFLVNRCVDVLFSIDLVQQFFSKQADYGSRLQVKHILSREDRAEACFHGRIDANVLTPAFLQTETPNSARR